MSNALILCAALWLGCVEARAQDMPMRVTVPAHAEWCASSQPVDIAKQTDPEFGALVFQILYARIEQAALVADLKSVGVPYLAATADVVLPVVVPPAPSPPQAPPGALAGAAPVSPAEPEPSAMKIFTVCAVVPPASPAPAPGQGITVRSVAAGDFFALRCEAKFDEDCKAKITAAMAQAQINVSKLTEQSWSIRQATSSGADAAALIADLSDHSLRTLQESGALAPPAQMITVAAAVP